MNPVSRRPDSMSLAYHSGSSKRGGTATRWLKTPEELLQQQEQQQEQDDVEDQVYLEAVVSAHESATAETCSVSSSEGHRGGSSEASRQASATLLPEEIIMHDTESSLSDDDDDEDEGVPQTLRDFLMVCLDKQHDGQSNLLASLVSTSDSEVTMARQRLVRKVTLVYQDSLQHLESTTTTTLACRHAQAGQALLRDFLGLADQLAAAAWHKPSDSGNPQPAAVTATLLLSRFHGLLQQVCEPLLQQFYATETARQLLTAEHASQLLQCLHAKRHMQTESSFLAPLFDQEAFARDTDLLLKQYLQQAVRPEVYMQSLTLTSKHDDNDNDERQSLLPDNKNDDDSQHVSAGQPTVLLYLVDSQLEAARARLPSDPALFEQVYTACLERISHWQSESTLHMSCTWQSISILQFCALLNDADAIRLALAQRNEQYLQQPAAKEMGRLVLQDWKEWAWQAVHFLAARLLLEESYQSAGSSSATLKTPLLSQVGSVDWESNARGTALRKTIGTLEERLVQVQKWLVVPERTQAQDQDEDDDEEDSTKEEEMGYFPQILRQTFDLTMQTYVESFFANTMQSGIQDPEAVANLLDRDHLRLVVFFNGSVAEAYHGVGGFYTVQEINWRLRLVQSIMRILNPAMEPDEQLDDVVALLRQFECGRDGTPAVLHLAGLRKKHTSAESAEWLKVIARAEGSLNNYGEDDDDDDEDRSHTNNKKLQNNKNRRNQEVYYRLPDLRNSEYILNIRVNRGEMQRRMSMGSYQTATATGEVIRSAERQRKKVDRARRASTTDLL